MAYYNPFKEDYEKEPNLNWYIKTALHVGIIAGAGLTGYRFIKGPTGSSLRKFQELAINKLTNREMAKAGFQTGENFYPSFSSMGELIGRPAGKERTDSIITTGDFELPEDVTTRTRSAAERLEEEILELMGVKDKRTGIWSPFNLLTSEKDIRDEMFAPIRQDTLREHIDKYSIMGEDDFDELGKILTPDIRDVNKKAAKDTVNATHRSYLSNRYHSKLYLEKLLKVKRTLQTGDSAKIAKMLVNPHKYARKIISAQQDFTSIPVIAEVYSKEVRLPDLPTGRINPDTTIDIAKEVMGNKKDNIFTADSGFVYGSKVVNDIKKFDYTNDFKDIVNILEEKAGAGNKVGIGKNLKKYTLKMEERITPGGHPIKTAVLTMWHSDVSKDPISVEIPVTVDGRMPSSSPFLSTRLDRTVNIQRTMGDVNEIVPMNMSKEILNQVHKYVSGSPLQEFDENPERFRRGLENVISQTRNRLAISTGTLRDIIKMTSFEDLSEHLFSTGTKKFATARQQLELAVSSGRKIRALATNPNALVVHLDLEVLTSNGVSPTPQTLADYKSLQLYKGGLTVMDPGTGTILHGTEVVSNHVFDKIRNFNDDHRKWFMKVMEISDPNEAEEAFRQQLNSMVGKNTPGIRDNMGFVREIKNQINEIERMFGNKDIYIATKYGEPFDLNIIKSIDPLFYNRIKPKSIDTHSLHFAEGADKFSKDSLQLSRVLQNVLGRDEGGFEVSGRPIDPDSSVNLDRVLDKLGRYRKGIRLSKGTFNHLIHLPKGLRSQFKKKMYLEGTHNSPTVDNLYSLALLTRQISNFLSGSSDFYNNLDSLDAKLKGGRLSRVAQFHQKAIERFGRYIPGRGFEDLGAVTQGMAGNDITSFMGLNDIIPTSEIPRGKPFDQFLRGQAHEIKLRNEEGNLLKYDRFEKDELHRIQMRHILPINTKAILDSQTSLMRSDSNAHYFARHVKMKTLFAYNAYFGRSGYHGYTNRGLKKTNLVVEKDWILSGRHPTDNPQLSHKLFMFERETRMVAAELAGIEATDVAKINMREYYRASRIVSERWRTRGQDFRVKSGESLGFTGALGDIRSTLPDNASIALVHTDRIAGKAARSIVRLQYHISPETFFNHRITSQTLGSKAESSFLADWFAFGKDLDSVVSADFMEKGYLGVAKYLMLGNVVEKHLQIINDKFSTSEDIRHSKEMLKRIAREQSTESVKVEFTGKMLLWDNNSLHELAGPEGLLSGDEDLLKKRFSNDVNLTMNKLMGYMKDSKMIWTQKNIDLYRNLIGGVKGQEQLQLELLKATRRDIDALSKQAGHAYNTLTKKQITRIEKEYQQIIQTSIFPNAGDPIGIIHPYLNMAGDWALGMEAFTGHVFSSALQGRDATSKMIKIKSRYLMALGQPGSHFSGNLRNYFLKNANVQLSLSLLDARNKYDIFTNTLLGEQMGKQPLSIDTIRAIIRPENRSEFKKELEQVMFSDDINYLRDRLAEIEEMGPTTKNYHEIVEELGQKIDSIQETLNKRATAGLESSMDSHRIVSSDMAARLQSLGTKRVKKSSAQGVIPEPDEFGVIRLAARPSELGTLRTDDSFTINVRQELDTLGKNVTMDLDNWAGMSLIKALTDADNKINMKKIENPLFSYDPSTGTMKIKQFILPAFGERSNIGGDLSTHLKYLTASNGMIMEFFDIYEQYYSAVVNKDTTKAKEAEASMASKYIKFLVSDRNEFFGKIALADDISVPTIWARHKGAESVIAQAVSLLERGGYQSASFKHISNFKEGLGKIKNSRIDTYFVTASNFLENAKVRVNRPSGFRDNMGKVIQIGEPVQFAKQMERTFGKNYMSRFKDGIVEMPGFFARFPITQSGMDGIMDGNIMVIPDEMAAAVGMDKNSIYAHWMLSKFTGADSDGDDCFLGLKHISTIEQFMGMGKADRLRQLSEDQAKMMKGTTTSLKGFLNRADVQNELRESLLLLPTRKNNQLQTVRYILSTGEPKYETLAGGILNNPKLKFFDNLFKKTLSQFAESNADVLNGDMIRFRQSSAILAQISKKIIGPVTNSMTDRIKDVWMRYNFANGTLGESTYARIIGSLETGAAGLMQKPISLAKHGAEQQIANIAMATDFLMNPRETYNLERGKAFRNLWMEGIRSKLEDPAEINRHAEALNAFLSMTEQSRKFKEVSSDFATYDAAFTKRLVTQNPSLADIFNTEGALENDEFLIQLRNKVSDTQDRLFDRSGAQVLRDFGDAIKTKLKLKMSTEDFSSFYRKGAKYGAIGAGIFLALNFFRPNQMSNSLNPLDMFQEIGDFGNVTPQDVGIELSRKVALDAIDPSFSKSAYIEMTSSMGHNKRARASVMDRMYKNETTRVLPGYRKHTMSGPSTYSNQMKYIGTFGNQSSNRMFQ